MNSTSTCPKKIPATSSRGPEMAAQVPSKSSDRKAFGILLAVAVMYTGYLVYGALEFISGLELATESHPSPFKVNFSTSVQLLWLWFYFILAIIIGPGVLFLCWFKSN
ncbi:hypothetical protein HDE_09411 [Halotydeus destructor]|nr:hypothetical protein HDE_09411 [Halotydeus destructor]